MKWLYKSGFKPGELGDIWAVASVVGLALGMLSALLVTWLK